MPEVAGAPATGERLRVRIVPPGGTAMAFAPTVLDVVPGRALRWLGRLLVPGLFEGEHRFFLEPLGPRRTRFVQKEQFRGLLVPLFARTLAQTESGFHAMNAALKARVEAGV